MIGKEKTVCGGCGHEFKIPAHVADEICSLGNKRSVIKCQRCNHRTEFFFIRTFFATMMNKETDLEADLVL
jgi:DNA-directed RNA polymerase subunit RPC12/RpoP